jgi:hypothetical protein
MCTVDRGRNAEEYGKPQYRIAAKLHFAVWIQRTATKKIDIYRRLLRPVYTIFRDAIPLSAFSVTLSGNRYSFLKR